MGRGIKKTRGKDLRKLDKNSQEYWNEVLRREGLSMDAGRDPGHRDLLYVGDSNQVANIVARVDLVANERMYGRRVKPKKQNE